jgi:3-methyladenine DNA glycosylase AlkD
MAQTGSVENADKIAAEIAARISSLHNWKTEDVRAVRREFSKRLAKEGPRLVIDVAVRLMETPGIEHRFVAYELVSQHATALATLGAKDLERFGRGIDSWGAVDCFACYLAGPAWREHQVSDRLIHGWTRAANRWWRRAALVSTVPLNCKARGGRGDALRTIAVCRILVGDRDDMVVKAMSWALRELSKHDAKAVKEFLADYANEIAPRVAREVRNKLSTGLKNPRRRKT